MLAQTKIPIIISTGMSDKKDIDNALEIITKSHENISILHCLSQYPSEYKNLNLNTIPFLKQEYPNYKIGYSDHSIGISIPISAVAMGAEIIEKHITLDRNMKGTDHIGSLAPKGLHNMIRDIRNLEDSFGEFKIIKSKYVLSAKNKLERSIASKSFIPKNTVIKEDMLKLLSPGDGYKWAERKLVIGQTSKTDISKNEIIYSRFLKNEN
jgi:sialic acid synthase